MSLRSDELLRYLGQKSMPVLDGVILGRKVAINILTYHRVV